ncbi:arsenic resistance protein [Oceanobacillus bengalensis]|uniref:Arsenic resistance protein n=1 Tax=Oceanobacillus bengalensis TaxID=1435466 RepID=A0A494YV34_9BACI|nr:bile acid:sodium symporter [Oceanobacillus bengalensis]RKQ14048.1 arsenic resistance protein [Oceanobacillus bengalensis]
MGLFEKLYTVLIILSVLIGLIIGQVDGIEIYADKAILPLLIIMLYITFLQIPVKDIKRSFSNRKFTLASIGMNFILTPLLAWLLAATFLADNPALWLGFIMLMVTPCTDWYIIFTGIAKGNVALSTSILPLNLILQLVLLPLYLYLFSGTVGIVDVSIVVESILLVLILPFVAAYLTRCFLLKKKAREERLLEKISSLPVVFLGMAIIAMFASQGRLLLDNLELLLQLLLPILGFFFINFIMGRIIGRIFKFNKANKASLNLTTLARNSPIALAIAMTAFPHEPLIALVLIIGPLIELPLLSLITYLILKIDSEPVAIN